MAAQQAKARKSIAVSKLMSCYHCQLTMAVVFCKNLGLLCKPGQNSRPADQEQHDSKVVLNHCTCHDRAVASPATGDQVEDDIVMCVLAP